MEKKKALEGAVNDVVEGKMSWRKAAAKWGVKKSTLGDRITGRVALGRRSGPPPILTADEEDMITNWTVSMAERGFTVTKTQLRYTVKKILDKDGRQNPLKHKSPPNLPGDKWYRHFLERNPKARLAISKKVDVKETKNCESAESIWFTNFKTFLSHHSLLDKPTNIWNYGELSFSVQTKTGKVLGTTNRTVTDPQITVEACINAAGLAIPPYFLFPKKVGRQSRNPLEGSVPGSSCYFTEKGLMDSTAFHAWFSTHFIPNIPSKRPSVLLHNSSESHLDYETFKLAEENQILLFRLLPNTSNFLQPCDVALLSPMKISWSKVVSDYVDDNPSQEVNIETFTKVFRVAWGMSVTYKNVVDGFSRSGIYPPDKSKFSGTSGTSSTTFVDNP
ncbi:uncharacterized protein [Ptychodera flava]|uniref:uncharacterized protein n=1 Tax=Ptychodera flava TaxID=63121 RepID=UPI00396A5F63